MISIYPDPESLFAAAARLFAGAAETAMRERAVYRVALAGGSTPRALYSLLASDAWRGILDWRRVRFFFGDERMVPADDADSNYRMANETLFGPLGISSESVFRWRTELGATEAARDYGRTLAREVPHGDGSRVPRFDLILLGMGPDGHTASLFPFTPALDEAHETAVANPVGKLSATRLTITYPLIASAGSVVFLVAGGEKAPALRDVIEGPPDSARLPAQGVKVYNGSLAWLVDAAAASMLSSPKTTGDGISE